MGATPFIMVLLGCSAEASQCQPILTMPVAYTSEASCLNSRAEILALNSHLGFARVEAQCRPHGAVASRRAVRPVPSS